MEDLLDDDDFDKLLGNFSEKPNKFPITAADTNRRETEDDDFF